MQKKQNRKLKKYSVQVQKKHYDFSNYVSLERWISYYYQIDQINLICKELNKKSLDILEIGPGDGIVSAILREKGHRIKTMDIDSSLNPDYVSALPAIDVPDKSKFDCILCCEVLEHIRFEDVERSLVNMAKLTKYVVISVPHVSLTISATLKILYFKTKKILITRDISFRKHRFLGQHYWELGYREFGANKFYELIEKTGFTIIRDFRIIEHPWHHFFTIKK